MTRDELLQHVAAIEAAAAAIAAACVHPVDSTVSAQCQRIQTAAASIREEAHARPVCGA